MGFGNQRIEIGQRAEHRIDIVVIGDVIAEILHRRGEEGRNPDCIGAKAGNMRQARGDALQVADAVAVGVLIGARIDLVDHRATPPVLVSDEIASICHCHV